MCEKYDDLFKDLVHLDETKARDYLISSGLASIAKNGRTFLTHAGVLLCCKREHIPRSAFHVHVKFKQESDTESLSEELFGSILYLYDELHQRLKPLFRRRLGSPDIRDKTGSEAVFFDYPAVAIIEALANFLIHRDYSVDDVGFITVYPDRVEFINPGQSVIPTRELETATTYLRPKYQRNQRLIEAMNKARINQREGGGILRIRRELEKNQSYLSDGSLGLSIENDPERNRFALTIYKRDLKVEAATPAVQRGEDILTAKESLPLSRRGNAPPLPSLIVGREDALRDLKSRLSITSKDAAAGVQVLTAVRGWPGVGKTTLAAAIAHDPDIVAAFPDGVLWASLGQTPSILAELAAWGRALGTDDVLRAHTVEEASAQLSALLRNQRCLLIVDDVWEPVHAKSFIIGGHGCAVLVTTRLPSVAQALAPTPDAIYKLAVLTDQDALELLKKLAPTVVAKYPEPSLELVRELEGLPLALQVAGHLLNVEASYGFDVSRLINDLREGARLLEFRAPTDRADLSNEITPTVAILLQRSTDLLDEPTRNCFAGLGVFASKPATFDLDAMKAVWGVEDPKPIARILVDRGLLEPAPEIGRFQIHALLIMHAQSLLVD